MGDMLQMQEQTKDQRVGVWLRTPHLPQVPRHRATASVRPEVALRATPDARRPLSRSILTAQSFQVMIWSVAERPERLTTVIKLLVVSSYVALTHSIEPMVSRFQAMGWSAGSG
jgi:hypothetical protein